MSNKPSEINPIVAVKMVDKIVDILCLEVNLSEASAETINSLSRSEISEIIHEMHRMRQASRLILNFGKNGEIVPEVLLKGESAVNFLLNRDK